MLNNACSTKRNKDDSQLVTARSSDRSYLIAVEAGMSTRSQTSEVTLVDVISYRIVNTVLAMAPRLVLEL